MLYIFTSKVQFFTSGITDKCSNSIIYILNTNTQFNYSYSSDCLQNTLACVLCILHAATMWTHQGVINFFQNNGNHWKLNSIMIHNTKLKYHYYKILYLLWNTLICWWIQHWHFIPRIIVIYLLWNPPCHVEFERRHFACAMACNSRRE